MGEPVSDLGSLGELHVPTGVWGKREHGSAMPLPKTPFPLAEANTFVIYAFSRHHIKVALYNDVS